MITDCLVVAAPIADEAVAEHETVLRSIHVIQTRVAIFLTTAGHEAAMGIALALFELGHQYAYSQQYFTQRAYNSADDAWLVGERRAMAARRLT